MSQPIKLYPGKSASFAVQLTVDRVNYTGIPGGATVNASVITADNRKRLWGPVVQSDSASTPQGTAADWPNGLVVVQFASTDTETSTEFTGDARLQIGVDDGAPWESEIGLVQVKEAHI